MSNFWDADTPAQPRAPDDVFGKKPDASQRPFWLDDAPASQQDAPSPVAQVAEWVSSIPRRVGETIAGQNEFDIPEITQGSALVPRSSPDFPRLVQEAGRTGGPQAVQRLYRQSAEMEALRGRLNTARGDQAQLDVLRQADPTVETARDRFGNTVVRFRGQPFYLNRSGVSARDVNEFVNDAAAVVPFAVPISSALQGANLGIRAAGQALAGVLGSGVRDVVSANSGSRQGFDWEGAMMGAIGGAGGEIAGSAINGIIQRVRNNPARFVTPTGGLTDDGARVFAEAGFDPADVSSKMAQRFAERSRQTGPNAATARQAAADEFGIPLSRGQATGDFDQIAFEQAAQRGARGQQAGAVMREVASAQDKATRDAFEELAGQLGQRAPGAVNEREAASQVASGLRTAAERSRQGVDDLYSAARGSGASVQSEAVSDVGQTIRNNLSNRNNPVIIDDALTPFAARALREVDELSNLRVQNVAQPQARGVDGPGASDPADIAGVSVDGIERVRQRLNALYRQAPGTEKGAVRQVIGAFDDWFDDVAERAMLTGSDNALDALKAARAANRRDRQLFGASGPGDDAGKAMQRLLNPETTAQEAANIIYGHSRIGESGTAVRLVQRIASAVGRDSPEFDAIRRGIVYRLTMGAEDAMTQPGARAIQNRLSEFIGGRGSDLANVLLKPEEIGQLRRLAAVLRTTVPPPGSVNHSGSGYEAARAIQQSLAAGADSPLVVRLFTRYLRGSAITDAVQGGAAVNAARGAPVVRATGGVLPASGGAATGMQYDEYNARPVR